MNDLGKIIVFIFIVFAMLFGLAMLGKSQESVLVPYEPIQSVYPCENHKKPYMMVTKSDDYSDLYYVEPKYKIIDYGTYHEIDSLKCFRYKQMQWKMYHLDKLNEKSCE